MFERHNLLISQIQGKSLKGTYAAHHCLLWYGISCDETDHSKLSKVKTEAIFAIFAL